MVSTEQILCVRMTENFGGHAESDHGSRLLGTSLVVRLLMGSYRITGTKDCVLWECGLHAGPRKASH